MKGKIEIVLTVVLLFIALALRADAQQVTMKPFSVQPSSLIADLKNLKSANPKMSADDFAKTANDLLEKQGLNFVVAFDAVTCRKIIQAKNNLKDPASPLNLRAVFKSPLGENASVVLPEPLLSKTDCVPCSVLIPFMATAGQEFVTVVEGRNIKFYLPANFALNEVALVDEKDLKTVKQAWKIPFRTTPLSISNDGTILYLGFDEAELSDLMLLFFSEGVFRIAPKKELDLSKKGVLLDDFPKDAANPNLSLIKFQTEEFKQVLRFSKKCPN